MKQVINIIYLIVFTLCSKGVHAQSATFRDSSLTVLVQRLSEAYSLSPSQEAAFLSIERQHRIFLDSLGDLHQSPEQRKQCLADYLKVHDHQLKSILNDVQWKKYTAMQEAGHAALLKHVQAKKIIVQEVPRQNL